MAKSRKIEVELLFNSRGAVIGIKDANGKIRKLADNAEKTERRVKKGFRGIAKSASKALGPLGIVGSAAGAALALQGMARAVIQTGMKFEQSMARVGALTQATGAELQDLTATARELGATTVFSANEVSEGMQFLAMAGFETSEIVQAMPGLLDQAAAGQIDLGRAADITSNVLSGFNLNAAESARVADVLTKASISSNTTIEGLGQSMAFVAPVAASLGLSLEELTAATGIMGDAGIQATRAGTALRGSLLQLAAPSKQQRKVMDELGFSFTEADGSTKNLVEIIGELEAKTKNMTKAQRTATLAVLVGQEAASGFTTLVTTGSKALGDFTKELENSGGTAKEVAEQQLSTLQGSIKLMNSALDELKITLFEVFSNSLQNVTDDATRNIGRLTQLFKFDLPEATNRYREVSAKANAQIFKDLGNVITIMTNPFGGINQPNPFIKQIEYYNSLAANARDAQEAITELQKEIVGPVVPDGIVLDPESEKPDTPTGGDGDKEKEEIKDRLTLLIEERDELVKKGEITNRLIALNTQILEIEQQRALVREGSKISELEAHEEEIRSTEDIIDIRMRRTEQELSSIQKEIDAWEEKNGAVRRAQDAYDNFVSKVDLGLSVVNSFNIESIRGFEDLAIAVLGATEQIINAYLNQAIAAQAADNFKKGPIIGLALSLAGIGIVKGFFGRIANKKREREREQRTPGFATGITGFGGGTALVGERGPELVTLGRGANVITNQNTSRILDRLDRVQSPTTNVNVSNSGVEAAIMQLSGDIRGMRIELDYHAFNDGQTRHNRHQRLIGNTAR